MEECSFFSVQWLLLDTKCFNSIYRWYFLYFVVYLNRICRWISKYFSLYLLSIFFYSFSHFVNVILTYRCSINYNIEFSEGSNSFQRYIYITSTYKKRITFFLSILKNLLIIFWIVDLSSPFFLLIIIVIWKYSSYSRWVYIFKIPVKALFFFLLCSSISVSPFIVVVFFFLTLLVGKPDFFFHQKMFFYSKLSFFFWLSYFWAFFYFILKKQFFF